MRSLYAISAATALALGGCATVPQPIAGNDFTAITPQQAVSQNAHGARVRWGGEIIRVDPKPDSTCFEVLSRELYSDARPSRRDNSDGRFIACSKGFYDPAVYVKGRDLTITGELAGTEQHQVGDYNYTYARVDADNVYMWPRRSAPEPFPYYDLLHYALVFLLVAIVAGVLGFGGIAGAAAGIAKILFLLFLVLFLASLIFGSLRRF